MEYRKVVKAQFLERENRFVARVKIEGKEVRVHVKNTGRCRELLVEGCTVFLEDFAGRMGTRKMQYSLIGVEKRRSRDRDEFLMINMDSQAPNKVVMEALCEGRISLPGIDGRITVINPEKTYGSSRLDFYVEAEGEREEEVQRAFIEVKGVTLEENGTAMFPDAPTERGIKHIRELVRAVQEGFKAYIFFVIQMKGMNVFRPNYVTHPAFGRELAKAREAGVAIVAYDCLVTEKSLTVRKPVPINLEEN